MLWSVSATAEEDCPDWVKEKGKCEDFLYIQEKLHDYIIILESPYEIVDAKYKDGYVYATIKRGSLEGEVVVGKFDNVTNVYVSKGKIVIHFNPTDVWFERLKGAAGGVGSVLLILLVLTFF